MNTTDHRKICSHCGAENSTDANAWISGMNPDGPGLCIRCGKPYDGGSTDSFSRSGGAQRTFSGLRFLLIAGILVTLVIYLHRQFGGITSTDAPGQIIYAVVIILVISAGLASGRIAGKLKYLGLWGVIFAVSMVGYSYRHDIGAVKDKVLAELMPATGYQKTSRAISFPMSANGHFYIRAQVNGIPMLFLADTGASSIVLSPDDAKRLGIRMDRLKFDRFYDTANGTVRGSSIRLAEFRVGGLHLEDVGASVNEAEMGESLLGMTFFKRLKGYSVKDDTLTLYFREPMASKNGRQ